MSPSMTPEVTHSSLRRHPARIGPVFCLRLALIAIVALAALSLVGCGGGDDKAEDNDVLLATVGATEVLSSYYEDRLSLLKLEELPIDTMGQPMDMSTQEAKEKFLDILINKETMAKTAVALGYDNDPQITGARASLLSYEGGLAMWAKEISEPANTISEEQLQAFYEKMGKSRQCRYVITNFEEQAKEAYKMALSGADWEDVVAKYHDGDEDPTGKYEITVPFGRYNADFDIGVYTPEVGGVGGPISTSYGFWVLKIDSEKSGKRPPLDEAKAKILDVTRGRMISELRLEFKKGVREKYKFFINEETLWKCFQGLPADEEMFYPGTKDAVKRDDLKPLNIPTVDRELPFYGYTTPDGDERLYSLGDYKTHFDNMSVFQRPKRAQMMGGLRGKVTEELEKTLVNFEAEELGYFKDPDVLTKVDAKIEELLVNKLYQEMVTFSKRITPEELDAFWAEHEQDYFVPATRTGRLVVCATRAMADKAFAAASEGATWRDVLVDFGTDKENKSRSGKLEKIRTDAQGSIRDALFALSEGEISPAFAIENGSFGVVMLETINEPYQIELSKITESVGNRMKQIREEEAFQAQLTKWKSELNITTYPENLAGLKSWKDLTTAPVPENLVPRN